MLTQEQIRGVVAQARIRHCLREVFASGPQTVRTVIEAAKGERLYLEFCANGGDLNTRKLVESTAAALGLNLKAA